MANPQFFGRLAKEHCLKNLSVKYLKNSHDCIGSLPNEPKTKSNRSPGACLAYLCLTKFREPSHDKFINFTAVRTGTLSEHIPMNNPVWHTLYKTVWSTFILANVLQSTPLNVNMGKVNIPSYSKASPGHKVMKKC